MATEPDSPDPRPRQAGDPRPPKVIYVMGQPKSGSTILGVTLGNLDDVFFAGELVKWTTTSGQPILGGAERVRFWRDVRDDVQARDELAGPQAYEQLERGASALRLDLAGARRRLRGPYRQVTRELFRAVADRSGATHVVDTSHLPLRARELQSVEGIDLYIIFLVRKVESIVSSQTRHPSRRDATKRQMELVRANLRIWSNYLMALAVFLRQPQDRRILLRHEDFIANPQGVLRELSRFIGSTSDSPDLASLRTGLGFDGNPLLRSEVVALNAHPAPPHRSSRALQLVERPWTSVLARLQPAATGANFPGPASS